jgi:2-polyprenyl-3-methyl-5-hydroxy-6-metoxy-1,4-benzoquinol methylase
MNLMSNIGDYIIKDGQFIGKFEKLYQNCEEPWNQVDGEIFRTDKYAILNLIAKYNCKNVMEIGCGLGSFTQRIFDLGVNVTGIDVSQTAIKKAKEKHPGINFFLLVIFLTFLFIKRLIQIVLLWQK